MKIKPRDFRLAQGQAAKLLTRATQVNPFYTTKKDYKEKLAETVKDIADLQPLLFASNQYALLLIFQGMDTAGKDGAISHVLSGVNPLGFQTYSFKQPSPEELDHDFLWRTNVRLPERGRIGIFNRSYYEEVLVVRVHPQFLEGQHLPPKLFNPKKLWQQRYESINATEAHLVRNGTRILKFYLHLSKEEQARRLLARIENAEKNWKFNAGDIEERKFWDKYIQAYEACLSATSTKQAPWYVVPADDKENARLIISKIVRDELKDLGLKFPQMDKAKRQELLTIEDTLKSELRQRY